jgi:hypothetical protein
MRFAPSCGETLPHYSASVCLPARRPAFGTGKKVLNILAAERDKPTGALGSIVAHFEAAIAARARLRGDSLFHRSFLARLSSRAPDHSPAPHARIGETPAAPIRRRSLIHACWIVIQNRREPALNLRDAPAIAAGVTSLPVYGGWVRRSRRAMRRVQPDRRESKHRYDNQTNDSYEYPTFGFHFPPPWLNRHPPEDPVSQLRLPLSTSLGKTEPSPRYSGPPKLVSHHRRACSAPHPERNADDTARLSFTYNNNWINLATCSHGAVSLSTPRPTVRATRNAALRSPLTRWWRATERIGQTGRLPRRGRRAPHGRFSRGGAALSRPPPSAPSSPAFLRRPEPIVSPNSSIFCANQRSKEIRENGTFARRGVHLSRPCRPFFAAMKMATTHRLPIGW